MSADRLRALADAAANCAGLATDLTTAQRWYDESVRLEALARDVDSRPRPDFVPLGQTRWPTGTF